MRPADEDMVERVYQIVEILLEGVVALSAIVMIVSMAMLMAAQKDRRSGK